jgi:hypothetical protein
MLIPNMLIPNMLMMVIRGCPATDKVYAAARIPATAAMSCVRPLGVVPSLPLADELREPR